MITQIEVESTRSLDPGALLPCYWVSHKPFEGEVLAAGQRILLAEIGIETPLTIRRTFVSLADGCTLPPRARVGTLLEILN